MPLHDWTRVDASAYYDFSLSFLVAIRRVLNSGVLPDGYTAYVEQATRVVVRHPKNHYLVAEIELASPANKASERALSELVRKVANAVVSGTHALVIDPFPPGKHDPNGVHGMSGKR